MKLLAVSIFGLGLGLAAVTASQAMPLAPLDQAASANTIQVAGGCGPGWHRGPYGGCRPFIIALPAGIRVRTANSASATDKSVGV
jgi:hypothetical protein